MTDVVLLFGAALMVLTIALVITGVVINRPYGLLWGLLILAITMFELLDITLMLSRRDQGEPVTGSMLIAGGILLVVAIVLVGASRRQMPHHRPPDA